MLHVDWTIMPSESPAKEEFLKTVIADIKAHQEFLENKEKELKELHRSLEENSGHRKRSKSVKHRSEATTPPLVAIQPSPFKVRFEFICFHVYESLFFYVRTRIKSCRLCWLVSHGLEGRLFFSECRQTLLFPLAAQKRTKSHLSST